jgi:hypothetical protein
MEDSLEPGSQQGSSRGRIPAIVALASILAVVGGGGYLLRFHLWERDAGSGSVPEKRSTNDEQAGQQDLEECNVGWNCGLSCAICWRKRTRSGKTLFPCNRRSTHAGSEPTIERFRKRPSNGSENPYSTESACKRDGTPRADCSDERESLREWRSFQQRAAGGQVARESAVALGSNMTPRIAEASHR